MKRNLTRFSAMLLGLLIILTNLPATALASGGSALHVVSAPIPKIESNGGIETSIFISTHDSSGKKGIDVESLPSSFRLPAARLTSVKNQNPYGTCWAHAVMASSESIAKSSGLNADPDFSEWQLAYFVYNSQNGRPSFDLPSSTWQNRGGNSTKAVAMFARGSSPVMESEAPYDGPLPSAAIKPSYDLNEWYIAHTPDEWKTLLMSKGALTINYYHNDAYYNDTAHSYYDPNVNTVNHGVTVVGWDDNYDASNFGITPPHPGAWIVKNSWGSYWGDNGYFYISYDDMSLGSEATGFELAAPKPGEKEYTYDDLGEIARYGVGDNSSIKCVFTSTGTESLDSVATFIMGDNMAYDIMVTTKNSVTGVFDPAWSSPQSGTVATAGYTRIGLVHPVALSAGQKYEVIFTLSVPGSDTPLPLEGSYANYSSQARFAPEQTYLSSDGTNWYDLYDYFSGVSFDACIFAFTVPSTAAPAAPTNVKAESASYSSIKVSWNAVAGASGYTVYRAASSTGTYSAVGVATSTSFINTSLATGTTYYYKVRAYKLSGSTKIYGGASAAVSSKPALAVPAAVAAGSASYNSNKVTWSAVAGATGYEVWGMVYGGSAYSLAGTVTSTSFTQSGLVTGTKYYYKVHAYRIINSTKTYGSWSVAVYAIPNLASPASVKAARVSSTGISVSWGAVGGAAGYEVWRYTAAAGIYSLAKTTANLSFTNTGLVTGTKYCYKVRAYRWVNSIRVYGGYSTYVSAIP